LEALANTQKDCVGKGTEVVFIGKMPI